MGWAKGLAGVVVAASLGGCATTPPGVPAMNASLPDSHRLADQPSGFASFCERFADQCSATPGGAAKIALNGQNWILLNAVNLKVNGDIWPEDDLKHYGRTEYWTVPTDGYGDCDDYAVTKRKDLLQAGLPAQTLRLAVVYSSASGRHAVLTVATDKGDFVLDNLTDEIRSWNATDYTWLERQDSADPMRWVALSSGPYAGLQAESPAAASNAPAGNALLQDSAAPTASTGAASH